MVDPEDCGCNHDVGEDLDWLSSPGRGSSTDVLWDLNNPIPALDLDIESSDFEWLWHDRSLTHEMTPNAQGITLPSLPELSQSGEIAALSPALDLSEDTLVKDMLQQCGPLRTDQALAMLRGSGLLETEGLPSPGDPESCTPSNTDHLYREINGQSGHTTEPPCIPLAGETNQGAMHTHHEHVPEDHHLAPAPMYWNNVGDGAATGFPVLPVAPTTFVFTGGIGPTWPLPEFGYTPHVYISPQVDYTSKTSMVPQKRRESERSDMTGALPAPAPQLQTNRKPRKGRPRVHPSVAFARAVSVYRESTMQSATDRDGTLLQLSMEYKLVLALENCSTFSTVTDQIPLDSDSAAQAPVPKRRKK